MATEQEDLVISVKNVSKDFLLPHEKTTSIKSRIVNIFKKRDEGSELQHAIKDVSFTVKEGEFFGILGRNGSGKSTLLKILAEIYRPTAGSVKVNGKLVPFIELGVGFNPELTGRENVYLNGALLGFSRDEISARYNDIVEFAELEDFMDQKLKNYSSGMQVRLAFSVATRSEADVLLVDEVLAVGDADFQRKCYDYFKSLKKQKKTVVFVTHDMGAVREYCDRAILIDEGLVTYEGKADKTADEYLKLFNDASDPTEKDDPESQRWGNRHVIVDSLSIDINNGEATLKTKLQADSVGADDFVFGYRFLDRKGEVIAVGNSLNAKGGRKLSLGPHESVSLVFTMPDLFGSGSFDVSVTVRLSDKVTVCDNWERATKFKVSKDESYYSVLMPAVMETEE